MGRRRAEPNFALVLAALDHEDRRAVERWAAALGLPPGGWHLAPPLKLLAELLAIVRLAGDMGDLSRGDAFAEACEALGLADDSELSTRGSSRYIRLLNRWLRTAYSGQNDQPQRDAA